MPHCPGNSHWHGNCVTVPLMSLDRGISVQYWHMRESEITVFYISQYNVDNHLAWNDGVTGDVVSVQSDLRSSTSVLPLVVEWLQLPVSLPALDPLSRPLQRWYVKFGHIMTRHLSIIKRLFLVSHHNIYTCRLVHQKVSFIKRCPLSEVPLLLLGLVRTHNGHTWRCGFPVEPSSARRSMPDI